VTWGRGNTAQHGNGDPSADATSPVHVLDPTGSGPLRDVTQIAADGSTELALLRDGTAVGWGDNFYGQLGPGVPHRVLLPVRIRGADGAPLGSVTGIAIGGQHALALLADGRVLAWGHNDRYQLGDGSRRDRAVPRPVRGPGGGGDLRDVVAVAAAEKHNAALRRDGTVVTWGNNTAGQLGAGTLRAVAQPVAVVGEQGPALLRSVRSVAVGEAYTVAVCADGDVLTWGANSRGQLGSGDRGGRARPGPVDTAPGVPFPLHITAVGAGQRHLLLLTR
jgi:alpha-tubulin suppressor-like RCC1 family protein